MAKKKRKKEREGSLVHIDEQNRQLDDAAATKGRRKRSRYTDKDKGSAQKLPGKKFDSWVWKSPDGEAIDIPVRLVKQKGRSRDAETERTYFQVVMPEYTINEMDTDIEELREKVFEAIEVPFEIEWASYFYIEVAGTEHQLRHKYWQEWGLRKPSDKQIREAKRDFKGCSGKLAIEIEVEEWQLGTTKGGRKVSRIVESRWGRDSHSRESHVRKGWPEEQAAREEYAGSRNSVLLPATADNQLALSRLIRSLSTFREQLDKLIHPENVAKAFRLESERLSRALPAPKKRKGGASG